MDITQIEKLLAGVAKAQGYAPLIVSEARLEKSIKRFPVAWIQLPKVLYVEGRNEGVVCHKIVMTLLEDYSTYSFEDKINRLAQMQEDALSMMAKLSLVEGIVEINSLTVTPRIVATTRHGDVAQLCEASVVSYF